ncbi:uncharacterized protein LOC134834368 [Culicoides brevitarsis]|uniref:uncharacterized protein LOC134834368 n=1 Tax=Culicoides brevitarsis TaxID=469753 RepID=UPI00307BD129
MTSKKTDGLNMSLDQYIEQSNFYFSPYGDINLVNHPAKKEAPVDESRDILDLSPAGDMADELSNIIKELDNAGSAANANQSDATLDGMIVQGKVKGLPKGVKPDVGLEHQGLKLPIQPGNNNNKQNRFNPYQRKATPGLKSKLQALVGKTRNANNFQRLPNVNPWDPWAVKGPQMPAPEQNLVRHVPNSSIIHLDLLNTLNLDASAFRNLLQKNKAGGLQEYLHAVTANLGSKYDMQIQRKIAEKQKKCLLETEDGFSPVSFDGPGIDESECLVVLGTAITLNSRFSAI